MSDVEEFRLNIEAYTPETMPMDRLAEYLAELAKVLGESTSVHFVRLETGSTSVVHAIQREAIPKIRNRTSSVARGIGPRDAVRAYKKINRLLREDNGRAVWARNVTAPAPAQVAVESDIIIFPGMDDAAEKFTAISQRGSLDGEVIRVGGSQKLIPITLMAESQEIAGCWATRPIAKELARRLFEPVRLFGTGRWNRNDDGDWSLDIFKVESFQPLRDISLAAALTELRSIQTDWDDGSLTELDFIRNGRSEAANGGV